MLVVAVHIVGQQYGCYEADEAESQAEQANDGMQLESQQRLQRHPGEMGNHRIRSLVSGQAFGILVCGVVGNHRQFGAGVSTDYLTIQHLDNAISTLAMLG